MWHDYDQVKLDKYCGNWTSIENFCYGIPKLAHYLCTWDKADIQDWKSEKTDNCGETYMSLTMPTIMKAIATACGIQ